MIIGKRTICYKEIDSTNAQARRLIKQGEGEGLVVTAEKQTRGRGKPGRAWFSPEGNLYLSVVVKPHKSLKDLAPITVLGALAARLAITKTAKLPVIIKWPNDLLIHGKKVGGVLVEGLPSGHLIIGIGVNINSESKIFPAELKNAATSLKIETGKDFSVEKFSASLISALDGDYFAYLKIHFRGDER